MAKVMFKYPLPESAFHEPVRINLPKGVGIHKFGVDGLGQLCFWADHLVNEKETRPIDFQIFGTGDGNIPDHFTWVDTVITEAGFVWHLYAH